MRTKLRRSCWSEEERNGRGFERYKKILKISYYYLIKEFELTNTINNLQQKHFLKKNEPQVRILSCYQKPADNITVLSNVCKPSRAKPKLNVHNILSYRNILNV